MQPQAPPAGAGCGMRMTGAPASSLAHCLSLAMTGLTTAPPEPPLLVQAPLLCRALLPAVRRPASTGEWLPGDEPLLGCTHCGTQLAWWVLLWNPLFARTSCSMPLCASCCCRERAPEWADEEPGQRGRMTAADMEAERLRMQEQWKKQGGTSHGAAQVRSAAHCAVQCAEEGELCLQLCCACLQLWCLQLAGCTALASDAGKGSSASVSTPWMRPALSFLLSTCCSPP